MALFPQVGELVFVKRGDGLATGLCLCLCRGLCLCLRFQLAGAGQQRPGLTEQIQRDVSTGSALTASMTPTGW